MNVRASRTSAFISSVAAMLLSDIPPAYAQSAADAQWQYEFTPYLWASAVSTTARIGPLSVHTSTSFSDLLSDVNLALSGWFEARKGRWGVVFDGFYARLSDSQGNVHVKVTQQLYGLAGAWRAVEGRTPVDVMAGLRYNYIKPTIETPTVGKAQSKDALDPFIGVRGRLPLSERWSLVGYADVGTFNGGDYAWQLLAGADYAYRDTRTVKLGYRRYKIKSSDNDFEITNTMQGLYIGLGFKF